MPHVLVYHCAQGLLTFLNQVEKKIMVCATLVHLLDTSFSSRDCSNHWIHCVSASGWVTGERKRRKDGLGNPHVIGYSHMINSQYGHVHKVAWTVTWSHDCHMTHDVTWRTWYSHMTVTWHMMAHDTVTRLYSFNMVKHRWRNVNNWSNLK